jgi:hypothetical protein
MRLPQQRAENVPFVVELRDGGPGLTVITAPTSSRKPSPPSRLTRTWISLVIRDGEPRQARGSHTFEPGDEALVLTETSDVPALRRLFEPETARDALQPALEP